MSDLACPDCGEDFWLYAETPEDRQRGYDLHLGTVAHKASLLGHRGRELMRWLAEERDKWLTRMGFIPKSHDEHSTP